MGRRGRPAARPPALTLWAVLDERGELATYTLKDSRATVRPAIYVTQAAAARAKAMRGWHGPIRRIRIAVEEAS